MNHPEEAKPYKSYDMKRDAYEALELERNPWRMWTLDLPKPSNMSAVGLLNQRRPQDNP